MKIYGNRQIKTLPGQETRPTLAKVREALFNIWQGRIIDCCWLDLCAGNGSMGAEALCRGAKEVVGIEKVPKACGIIRQNWQQMVTSEQYFQVICGDVIKELKQFSGKKFDFIYFDPPYASQLYKPVLEMISEMNLLTENGEIAIEHDPKIWQAEEILGLKICRKKVYGNTALTFYFLANSE